MAPVAGSEAGTRERGERAAFEAARGGESLSGAGLLTVGSLLALRTPSVPVGRVAVLLVTVVLRLCAVGDGDGAKSIDSNELSISNTSVTTFSFTRRLAAVGFLAGGRETDGGDRGEAAESDEVLRLLGLLLSVGLVMLSSCIFRFTPRVAAGARCGLVVLSFCSLSRLSS